MAESTSTPEIPSLLLDPEGANLVVVLGAPRSGTTWVAKIFDSHPHVLYRHEPDTVLRATNIPVLCRRNDIGKYLSRARDYLRDLLSVRTLKSIGSKPNFAKDYQAATPRKLHDGLVFALSAIDALPGGRWARRIQIPDLLSPGARPLVVFKTVSSRGRAGLFARAMPQARVIFILRHPCGQIASTLIGIRSGKFERRIPFDEILQTEEAREYGLTETLFAALPLAEQAAWHWAILNQKALNDLSGNPRVKIIRYEDLCRDPVTHTKSLYGFVGLHWNPQSENFLKRSTTAADTDEYFRIMRNSITSTDKWRKSLSEEDQVAILKVTVRVPVGQYYTDELADTRLQLQSTSY